MPVGALNIAGPAWPASSPPPGLRELGAEPVVYEKGTRAGGSMLLSSGFVWRYRLTGRSSSSSARAAIPSLQRLILERFDDALDWLEAQGVALLTAKLGTRSLSAPGSTRGSWSPRLRRDVRLGETTDDPTILATGGFPVRLAREKGLLLRANRWSEGDGLDLALARGARTAGDLDEFYGRAMATVEAVAEEPTSYAWASSTRNLRRSRRRTAPRPSPASRAGRRSTSHSRSRGGRAGAPGSTVERSALEERVRDRTVGEMVEAAREAGAPVEEQNSRVRVLVRAGVTQTLGGIRVDDRARAADGLYAAGADVGGISTGGWTSGLASALVLGLVAAESALG